jgi:anti-sigma28 factor (negative regulator of flagellin synthesis)
MKNFDDTKTVANNAKLEAEFRDERADWNVKIGELLDSVRNNSRLSEAQAFGLSYRQMLVEKMTQYRIAMHKKSGTFDKVKVERYKQYMTEGDYKLTASERADFVSADLSAVKLQLQLLQDQIDWIAETLQTLSSLQFAIKNKIEIIKEEIA